jgi:hypothetical protein
VYQTEPAQATTSTYFKLAEPATGRSAVSGGRSCSARTTGGAVRSRCSMFDVCWRWRGKPDGSFGRKRCHRLRSVVKQACEAEFPV